MSFFVWLILLLCFLSFGIGFSILVLMQYGPIAVYGFIVVCVVSTAKKIHRREPTELDDKISVERQEEALQVFMKCVGGDKQD